MNLQYRKQVFTYVAAATAVAGVACWRRSYPSYTFYYFGPQGQSTSV